MTTPSPARPAPRPLGEALRLAWYGSPFYALALRAKPPGAFMAVAPDPWPGEPNHATSLLGGRLVAAGRSDDFNTQAWHRAASDPAWLAALHRFDWLRDLRDFGGADGATLAAAMVEDWMAANQRWSAVSWRDDVIAARLANWVRHYDFLASGTTVPGAFAGRLVASLARQRRHLERLLRGKLAGSRLLAALKAAIIVDAAFLRAGPAHEKALARDLERLATQLPRVVLPDGAVADRNPAAQAAALRHLIDIRTVLLSAERPAPTALQATIDRAAPMLRFFRHGDGGLALFNGADRGDPALLDLILARSGDITPAPLAAVQGGFQRLSAGRALALMDCGAPPAPGLDLGAHAGTLSVEFSVGAQRVFGNCGAYDGLVAEWRQAMRNTAAHATAIIDDTNTSEVVDGGGLQYPAGNVVAARTEQDGATWVEASHEGYRTLYGVTHRRRLWLSGDGLDLRGEDTLEGVDGRPIKATAQGRKFAIRFHLHHEVKASLAQSGASALLRLPSGEGWRVRASGATIGVSDTVWLGDGERIRRAQQVSLVGGLGADGAKVKWAFTRVEG
ncbi:MAG: heparinase II/III family protein [Rhodospirillales bacterium]|nr:MAG: heparinase II/III family protein [Rhodospirillales bacterium]